MEERTAPIVSLGGAVFLVGGFGWAGLRTMDAGVKDCTSRTCTILYRTETGMMM